MREMSLAVLMAGILVSLRGFAVSDDLTVMCGLLAAVVAVPFTGLAYEAVYRPRPPSTDYIENSI